jgi:hypothetical protein
MRCLPGLCTSPVHSVWMASLLVNLFTSACSSVLCSAYLSARLPTHGIMLVAVELLSDAMPTPALVGGP